MCGLAQSTFLIVPLNLIGLFTSNSAEIEWCAAAGTAIASAAAASKAQTVRFILSSKPCFYDLVHVLRPLPWRDRSRHESVQIVLLAGVFHQHVRRRLDPPR